MASKYFLPRTKRAPSLGLTWVWAWVVTAKLWPMAGWAHGVFWTVYAMSFASTVYRMFTEEAYDAGKMDRILGGE